MEDTSINPWGWPNPDWPAFRLPSTLFTREEAAECDLFRRQARLVETFAQRRRNFEMQINKMKDKFDIQEQTLKDNMETVFNYSVKLHGIEKTRRTIVPAYTFTRFSELPKEIQLKIWSMAARFRAPKEHQILSWGRHIVVASKSDCGTEPVAPSPIPKLLVVCQGSRMVALKFFTAMPCIFDNDRHAWKTDGYINTLQDDFHILGAEWKKFSTLVKMFVNAKNGYPDPSTEVEVRTFARIRFLNVELEIWSSAPHILWTQFNNLEKLTIGFYPFTQYRPSSWNWAGDRAFTYKSHIVHPLPNSHFGKRATWLRGRVLRSLQEALKANPQCHWRIPKVGAVVFRDHSMTDEREFDGWGEYACGAFRAQEQLQDETTDGQLREHELPEKDIQWYRDAHELLAKDADAQATKTFRHMIHGESPSDTEQEHN